ALTALIPGPFLQNLTLRDLTIGGVGSQVAPMIVKGCVGVTLENVQCELADPGAAGHGFNLGDCRKVTLTNCRRPVGTEFGAVQNLEIYGGEITAFVCDEFSRQIEIHGARLSGDFTAFQGCSDVKIFGGSHAFNNVSVTCDRFAMYGAKVSAGNFGIIGASPTLVDVEFTSHIGYHLNPDCTDGFISGVRVVGATGTTPSGYIELYPGSTGQYTPVLGGGRLLDNSGGGWSALGAAQAVVTVPAAVNDYAQFGSVVVSGLGLLS